MPESTVDTILAAVNDHFTLSNNAEITLEANPTSVEISKFKSFRTSGINRVSLGVQSLDDTHLMALGRLHSAKDALSAFDVAKSEFDRVSFDLIYARQHQSLSQWEAELTQALSVSDNHLSLYQLTIEQGTAFGDRFNRGQLKGLPSEDLSADMYFLTQDLCNAKGISSYEVSNHAKVGQESVHNLIYWRGGDYACIGPGAHGRLTFGSKRYAIECYSQPNKWLDAALSDENGEKLYELIPHEERAIEYIMMCLRLSEGLSIERAEEISKNVINYNKINELVELGLVSRHDDTLKTTDQGRTVLNGILREILI